MLESPTEAGLSFLDEFLAGHGVHLGGDTVPKCIELLLPLDRPGLVGYKLFQQSLELCGPYSKEDQTVSDVHVSCRLRVVHCLQLEERELDLESETVNGRSGSRWSTVTTRRRRGMQLDAPKMLGRATRTEQGLGDSLSRHGHPASVCETPCRLPSCHFAEACLPCWLAAPQRSRDIPRTSTAALPSSRAAASS